jgi:hypothetical protein
LCSPTPGTWTNNKSNKQYDIIVLKRMENSIVLVGLC